VATTEHDLQITPESDLERRVLAEPEIQAGLAWGAPRPGHPEGTVARHVAAMLRLIAPDDPLRGDLRFLALVHDTFKRKVRHDRPWSPDNDHAVLARRFAEGLVDDERLLRALELHDEPYWQWRHERAPESALAPVLERIPDVELFARFVELDASTEGKDLTFLWWFRRGLVLVGQMPRHPRLPVVGAPDGDGHDDVLYVKTFGTEPEAQQEVADAARALVAEHAPSLQAAGEVLVSDDGLRVVVVWRWSGGHGVRLLREGEMVRDAFHDHPALARARPLDARVLRPADGGMSL
jgi:hypothetical protein